MTKLQRIRSMISSLCFIIFNRLCCLFIPLRKNQVCFLAETHKELNGNLKVMYDYLSEHNDRNLKFLVFTKEDRRDRKGIRDVLKSWKAISVSGCLLLDDLYTTTSFMKVRKGQEIVQLWHGAGAYKKFGHSRKDLEVLAGGKLRVHRGYKKYTKAIVSGSGIRWCYAEAFGMDIEKVHATGIPRMDELYDQEHISMTKAAFLEQYPELRGKKLVLFAPTYRGTHVRDAGYDFEKANLDGLAELLGENYVILTRWHPALKNNISRGLAKVSKCTFGDRIRDFTDYRDVNDLLIACDVLVTDYSSIIFDYFPLSKPIVYFVYDKDDYAGDRGLYYPFEKYVFGDVAETFDELAASVKSEKTDEERRKEFYELFLDSCDDKSTERVCELIWKNH